MVSENETAALDVLHRRSVLFSNNFHEENDTNFTKPVGVEVFGTHIQDRSAEYLVVHVLKVTDVIRNLHSIISLISQIGDLNSSDPASPVDHLRTQEQNLPFSLNSTHFTKIRQILSRVYD